ncbi:T6SS amidase immunity protein Tai4 family protein [Aquimarina sp. RZ0]|uniref:T6SS amidase immunity protein Tai4 family protein n=1 Tax=Aquimarina sp. RZ0 TaxID=2607730 RepID=UPI001CB6B88F|nr:T6SS amidase immunity protein Tai4 family protein [Aquimarina sp. RZ0]
MKNILLLLTLSFFIGCKAQKQSTSNNYQEIKDFKKYVLFQCLYKGIPVKDSLLRAEGSAAMYVQKGSYDIEYYEKAVDFINDYLIRSEDKYNSKTGANLTMIKCIDLYESEELNEFIKSLEK